MSNAVVSAHASALIAGLKRIYGTGQVVPPNGSPVSNGRGGFTTSESAPVDVYLQRESSAEELYKRNIAPDEALIYVLNTIDETVSANWKITRGGETYRALRVTLDPLNAVYECVCEHVA